MVNENHDVSNEIVENKQIISKKPIIILCVLGLFLTPISITSDSWLSANVDTDDFWGTTMRQNVYISLDSFMIEYCADDDCEIEEDEKLGDLYQKCYDEVTEIDEDEDEWDDEDDDNISNEEIEEMCGPYNDLAKAGETTKTLLLMSAFTVFVGILITFSPISKTYSIIPYGLISAGGVMMLFSIFNWSAMLPEFTENLDWDNGPNIAILSGIIIIIAGLIGIIQSRKSIQDLVVTSAEE